MDNQEQISTGKEKIIFDSNITREIVNFKSGEKYSMEGGSDMDFSENDVKKISEICSQENTYNILFKEMLEKRPYAEDDAKNFLSWVKEGWEKQTHFVFFIKKSDSEIIGCIDIKGADLLRAEVGYWADENYPGFMTNTLAELFSLAKGAGFIKLFAGVKSKNSKSIGVLERSGFKKVSEKIRKDGEMEWEYEKQL